MPSLTSRTKLSFTSRHRLPVWSGVGCRMVSITTQIKFWLRRRLHSWSGIFRYERVRFCCPYITLARHDTCYSKSILLHTHDHELMKYYFIIESDNRHGAIIRTNPDLTHPPICSTCIWQIHIQQVITIGYIEVKFITVNGLYQGHMTPCSKYLYHQYGGKTHMKTKFVTGPLKLIII